MRDPFFAKYISAYALSMTGMMVRMTAMGYLVYDLTGDPFKLGLMSFAQVAPEIAVSYTHLTLPTKRIV